MHIKQTDAALESLMRKLKTASSLGDATDIFNVVERMLKDELDDFNDVYADKVHELTNKGAQDLWALWMKYRMAAAPSC